MRKKKKIFKNDTQSKINFSYNNKEKDVLNKSKFDYYNNLLIEIEKLKFTVNYSFLSNNSNNISKNYQFIS